MRYTAFLTCILVLACNACTPRASEVTPPSPSYGSLALQLVAQRRAQATLDDIDHLDVSLELANGFRREEQLTRAALAATASLTYSELAPGDATVSMAAYDGPGRNLGSALATASILANQTTTATLSLELAPGYAFATPAPPPAL